MSYQGSTFRSSEQAGFQSSVSSSSRIVSSSSTSGVRGVSGLQGFQGEQVFETRNLTYESIPGVQMNEIVISGLSDINTLRTMKNVLMDLNKEFLSDGTKIVLTGNQKDQFNKRLILLEGQIEGLMKRKINAGSSDSTGRVLDYTGLLNQKENQIVQLEKKIQNLEQKLRRASKRQGQLEDQVVRLTNALKFVQNPNVSKQELERLSLGAVQYYALDEKFNRLKSQVASFGGLVRGQFEKLKSTGVRFEHESQLDILLKSQNIQTSILNGIVNVTEYREKVVEVPIQDARTKHLIHMLAVQMKKYFEKYPKLRDECDARLYEFFQQELIDIIEVDELERVVEIVKYVPQMVKVENVYAYSNEKSRKVEFHLRILIKALLEEMEKLKRKTGAVLEIDEGVIGMINQQIMGVVDVDDILKVFRVVPKIVEVEKIVEKIVDRIVQVPTIVPVERIIEKIVEVEKIREVEKKVPVPIQVPIIVNNVIEKIVTVERIVEKAIDVPTIVERIVEVRRQVPKIVEVQRFIEKIVEVEKLVPTREVVNHISYEVKQVQVFRDRIVPTEKIVQKIVEVPVIVEKIVEKIVQVPQIIEVERIVEKIVPQIEYRNAKEIQNHIQLRNVIVDRIIEKPIPIIQIQERIVEVPQIVEKIVIQNNTIREPYEVKVIVEKIVIQDRIKEIEKIVERIVEVIKQVPKQVERIVQVPVIHEHIIKVQQIIEKPVIQVIERQVPVIVEIREPLIVRQPKTIEVEKIVNHYIEVPKPIKYIQEKIVEVIRYVDRIKEIRVPVEKIIQKMVEVPKVVEVEKIVEKIIVVPRVVQKIVEVPQIVERVVPKIMIEERIKEVERIVQVPVIQERIVEVFVDKNVYIEVEKVIDRVVDKLVELKSTEEKIINHQVIVERVVEVVKEVPRIMEVQKIVYNTIQVPQIVEVEKQIIVPVEIPVPVQKIVEKLVPITEVIEKIVQVPTVIEKIVAQKTEDTKVVQVVKIEERIVVDTKVKQVVKEVPYIRDQIKEVQVMVEKIVPIQSIVQEVVTAKQIIEKVVQKSTIIPKIYEVEKFTEKIVEVPKIVEVERIIPQLVNVNRYIQSIVEKIVEVPIIIEQIKEIVKENQKIVEVRNEYTDVRQVERIVEKTVILQKFKEVVRDINHIEKVLQIVDRVVNVPVEIISHQEKLVEVPYILEKIVEKIVIMPQIVEVLKYVHEVVEQESLGVAVGVQFATHEQRYKLLTKDIKGNLDILLQQIRKLKTSNPALRIQIELIEKFLAELEQFILFPRIVQVPKEKIVEKIVEKERLVTLPKQDDRSVKMELTLSLLVEKLILELKRLKKDNPNINFNLEEDVKLIFFAELDSGSQLAGNEMSLKLKSFSDSIYRKFESLGNWSFDHQLMLNSFLQERFLMANLVKNANQQIQRSKSIGLQREDALKKYQSDLSTMETYISKIKGSVQGKLSADNEAVLSTIFRDFDSYITTRSFTEPMRGLSELSIEGITDQRIQSLIRQKDAEIIKLRQKIFGIEKLKISGGNIEAHLKTVQILQDQNGKLKNEIADLRMQKGSAELVASFKLQIQQLNERILQLEQEKSNLTAELINVKHQSEVGLTVYNSNLKLSGITGSAVSGLQSPSSMTSPVRAYDVNSPQQGASSDIRMVESQSYRTGGAATYGSNNANLADSRQSGTSQSSASYSQGQSSSSYGVTGGNTSGTGYQGYQATTLQQGSGYQASGVGSSSISGQSSSVSGYGTTATSNLYQAGSVRAPTYQGQTGATSAGLQGSTGQSGISSLSSYQASSIGGASQLGSAGQGSGYTFQSSTSSTGYRPATGTTGTTGATGSSGASGTPGFGTQGGSYSSSYTYNRSNQQ